MGVGRWLTPRGRARSRRAWNRLARSARCLEHDGARNRLYVINAVSWRENRPAHMRGNPCVDCRLIRLDIRKHRY